MEKTHKILVTGGAGFIGSHLVEGLALRGYKVTVFDNLSTGNLSNINSKLQDHSVEFIEGDIRDQELVKKVTAKINVVIHLAAQTSVPFSLQNPAFNNEVNVQGTLNLLKSSVQAKAKKFIFVSSCAVYGDPKYLPIDEKHPANPISPYAKSKLDAEKECLRLNDKHLLNSVVLRLFNVYGPRQGLSEYSGVITKFIDRIKHKLPLLIYGDGSQTRDFVYVQDVVNAITLALENEEVQGILNIGAGKAVTIQNLAETILSMTGASLEIIKMPSRNGDIKHSRANISKANKILGYRPEFSLTKGLKSLLLEHDLLNERINKIKS